MTKIRPEVGRSTCKTSCGRKERAPVQGAARSMSPRAASPGRVTPCTRSVAARPPRSERCRIPTAAASFWSVRALERVVGGRGLRSFASAWFPGEQCRATAPPLEQNASVTPVLLSGPLTAVGAPDTASIIGAVATGGRGVDMRCNGLFVRNPLLHRRASSVSVSAGRAARGSVAARALQP